MEIILTNIDSFMNAIYRTKKSNTKNGNLSFKKKCEKFQYDNGFNDRKMS